MQWKSWRCCLTDFRKSVPSSPKQNFFQRSWVVKHWFSISHVSLTKSHGKGRIIIKPAVRPSEAGAFNKLRRYHTMTFRFNWGPKNVHFGKTHFRNLFFLLITKSAIN